MVERDTKFETVYVGVRVWRDNVSDVLICIGIVRVVCFRLHSIMLNIEYRIYTLRLQCCV